VAELNINRPEWDADRAEPPFAGRVMRLGHRAAAAELGAALYEMDRAERSRPITHTMATKNCCWCSAGARYCAHPMAPGGWRQATR